MALVLFGICLFFFLASVLFKHLDAKVRVIAPGAVSLANARDAGAVAAGAYAERSTTTGSREASGDFVVRKAPAAHAARAARDIPDEAVSPEVRLPALMVDPETGETVDTNKKELGSVAGGSCERFGLRNGMIFLGDPIGTDEASTISPGDLVVVDADDAHVNVSRRIRKVEAVDGDRFTFLPDAKGKPHTERDIQHISVRITHFLAQ